MVLLAAHNRATSDNREHIQSLYFVVNLYFCQINPFKSLRIEKKIDLKELIYRELFQDILIVRVNKKVEV